MGFMKTEQEQIKAIKQIIDERVETTLGQVQGRHGNVIKTVDTVIIARDIVNAGYGDMSEYKAEIERLRQEVRDTDKMARNTIEQYRAENKELENALKQSEDNYSRAFERLKAQEREIERLKDKCEELRNEKWNAQDDLDCYCDEMPNKIKRAKIDMLNELKKYLHTEDFDTPDERWKPESEFCAIIDELVKEIRAQ